MKAANGLNTLTVSGEKLPRRPLMRFQMNRGTVIFLGGWGGVGQGEVNCKCVELAAIGWCTRKWLRLNQTVRNLTSGD